MKNTINKSLQLYNIARNLIPSCTQTFSKGYTQFSFRVSPVFIEMAKGCHVWDVDGNEYIDYSMALGAITLGYAYPEVNEAISEQLNKGIVYSLPHPLEVKLAETLVEIIPCAEMVRFAKNGSDVTTGAVRAARAYTGRDKIISCGYHGWHDWYIGTTTRNKGIPKAVQELTLTFEYNNIESLRKLFDENSGEIAAVVMEPIGIVGPEKRFLEKVKELTHKNGALLIFDEIVTGFRLSEGGAQEYFGVVPDLACYGKGMANGMPVSAVVGKREVMTIFDEIFFSFTFGGETISLAASIATINEMKVKGVIEYLWRMGRKLKDGFNALAVKHGLNTVTECIGFPPRTVITFKDRHGQESLELKTLFQQEAIKRGVLFSGAQNMCYSHTDTDIERTLEVYNESLEILARVIKGGDVESCLDGEIVQPVFRKA
ncbi:MAG: aminotransferase class III-fold pyridoxal phosphate-dependent enzyme [Candidatus Scalindua rubra]|nr:aminotransferase class III-fold pyridoxal phosphate-dependent enzyme [Candidatus Scalindua rubra]TWU33105.1 3-aminobutyryl-CoA aminotransferase [Candidatus Brocadiaceae bacterium S225]